MRHSQGADPGKSGIYRTIRILFTADLVVGLALAAAGYWLWNRVDIWIVGLGLAAVGIVMLLLFPVLMRRSESRGGNAVNRN